MLSFRFQQRVAAGYKWSPHWSWWEDCTPTGEFACVYHILRPVFRLSSTRASLSISAGTEISPILATSNSLRILRRFRNWFGMLRVISSCSCIPTWDNWRTSSSQSQCELPSACFVLTMLTFRSHSQGNAFSSREIFSHLLWVWIYPQSRLRFCRL